MNDRSFEAAAQEGVAAFQKGDFAAATLAFEKVTSAENASGHSWLVLSQCYAATGDLVREDAALDTVLAMEPRNVLALIRKGEGMAKRGDDRAAVSYFNLALSNAPTDPSPGMTRSLERAAAASAAASGRFIGHLEQSLDAAGFAPAQRPALFDEAIGIMTGRMPVQVQQPTSFFYPGLPQTSFYDPASFDWVAAFEAAAPEIRAELVALLDEREGFHPYVEGDPDRPNRGHALLDDRRWSAFDLYRSGQRVEENLRRCPATTRALADVPLPSIPGRSPMALFSLLEPRTHIPPHWGMLNTRLICHLPLIVPPRCRLRVGNHERSVEPGRMMIFDDSIEHEAWNDSDEVRIVLLFEIWRPEIGEREREALTAMFAAVGDFGSASG